MTKVKELREAIVHDWWFEPKVLNAVDSLISTAHAEGVTEGAEQERERIREASSYMAEGTQADCDQLYVHKEYHNGQEYHVILVGGDFYMVDPSVLAPTKAQP